MSSHKHGRIQIMDDNARVSTRIRPQVEPLEARRLIHPAGASNPLTEERLQEEEKKPKRNRPELPLKKSGERRDVGETRDWEEDVRELLEKHPVHFRALVSLVKGRKEDVTEQQIRDLRNWLYLARDRTVLPGVRDIIETAYRETLDGPCIVDPFDLKNPDDASTLQRADEQRAEIQKGGAERLRRAIFGRDKDEDKDRPR